MTTATRDLSWLASICDPNAVCSEIGKQICARPYSLDLDGELWSMGTDGIVAALISGDSGLARLDGAAADKFRAFVKSGLELKATIATTIAELTAWTSTHNCPTCGSHGLAIDKLPAGKVYGWLGKTEIDKRQLMRVLPHLDDAKVAIGLDDNFAVIQGEWIIVCLAGIDASKCAPDEITDRFAPQPAKKDQA